MALDKIVESYERAEITVIWLYDRVRNEHYNVFSVVELCPSEQPFSKSIKFKDGNEVHNMKRISLDKKRTLYATRYFASDPFEGISFYRGGGGKRKLRLDKEIDLLSFGKMVHEPPNEIPITVPPNKYPSTALAHILPKRPVSQRVCTLFDFNGNTLGEFLDKDLEKLSELTKDVLGIDLLLYQEFIGSIILSCPNPYLRNINIQLSRDQNVLIVELYERLGKSLKDGEIEISDNRSMGMGFSIRRKIEDSKILIQLPCSPEKLRIRLFDSNSEILSDESTSFIDQINVGMNIGGHQRRIVLPNTKDKQNEIHDVNTYMTENITLGREGASLQEKLVYAEEERMLNRLEEQRIFVYFPGNSEESKTHAKQIIRELIGSTKQRCIICDPYLSSQDILQYSVFIKSQKAKVQLLGSAYFLSKKIQDSDKTNGEHLFRTLEEIKHIDSSLRLECKILRGKDKSPLHDRFLVIDDTVYLLGSSLNEFGSRATTLFRAPDSRPIIRQIENWWNNESVTDFLNMWMNNRKEGDNNE